MEVTRKSNKGDTYKYDGEQYNCEDNAVFMPYEDTPHCFDKNLLLDIYGTLFTH